MPSEAVTVSSASLPQVLPPSTETVSAGSASGARRTAPGNGLVTLKLVHGIAAVIGIVGAPKTRRSPGTMVPGSTSSVRIAAVGFGDDLDRLHVARKRKPGSLVCCACKGSVANVMAANEMVIFARIFMALVSLFGWLRSVDRDIEGDGVDSAAGHGSQIDADPVGVAGSA